MRTTQANGFPSNLNPTPPMNDKSSSSSCCFGDGYLKKQPVKNGLSTIISDATKPLSSKPTAGMTPPKSKSK